MKEKHENGCNILIMTFTNLEKYVYSKKCLKQRRQPPPPPTQIDLKVSLEEDTIIPFPKGS